MTVLDPEAILLKLDKLWHRISRLKKNPDPMEWQYTRLLIRALTEGVSKSKKCAVAVTRRIELDAPEAVRLDWQELVSALARKGFERAKEAGRTRKRS